MNLQNLLQEQKKKQLIEEFATKLVYEVTETARWEDARDLKFLVRQLGIENAHILLTKGYELALEEMSKYANENYSRSPQPLYAYVDAKDLLTHIAHLKETHESSKN